MSKIRIKNFGPIKEGYLEEDGFLDIKKITIFIGNQGSGKSTVAKVISTIMWLEKAMNRGDYNGLSGNNVLKLLEYQGVLSYKKDNTAIDYCGDKYAIQFSMEDMPPHYDLVFGKNYSTPKIMYVPAERNTLTSISNIKGMPDHLLSFYEEWMNANKEINGNRISLPINDYKYEYNTLTDTSTLFGYDHEVNLLHASSGAQSLIPLYLVSDNLSRLVTLPNDILSKKIMSKYYYQLGMELNSLDFDNTMTETEKEDRRREIRAKYLPKCFVNIVEEPEQNLYPTSQRHILNSLLEFNNKSEGNKLIMTTHSPYIINYLSIAIQAGYLKDKIKSTQLLEKLNAIVPLNSTVKASDIAIYQFDEKDGTIKKLPAFEGIPSDKNFLNQSLAEGNELFRMMFDIEEEL